MEEYIAKNEVLSIVRYWQDKERVSNIPTITKADICKEIAEELCKQWNIDSLCSINNTEQMRMWIKSKLLNIAEMENEND